MKKLLRFAYTVVLIWGCQNVPEPAEKSYYISAAQRDAGKRPESCSFRYRIDNSFDKLDNILQQQSIRKAFDLWQNADPNILFLQKQDAIKTEVIIRFETRAETSKPEISPIGLIRGTLTTLSGARQEDNTYVISLDSGFAWDTHTLTRVMAYHVGKFLGLKETEETGSILNRTYVEETLRLSANDSIQLNTLFSKPCPGDCDNFLPFSLPVPGEVTKSIRIDKPGKITIRATGSMIVGRYLGWSTPKGLEKGIGGVPIGDLSIDRSIWHAALIYKFSKDEKWRDCSEACEFDTDGVSQCIDITFAVNDKNLTDNSGAYDIVVDYKK